MMDAFDKALADARLAVATFLPSLSPKPAPPPPAPPIQMSPAALDAIRALGLAKRVEMMSARVARGLPPEPPVKTLQSEFPPELDPIHIRALTSAIASHPEEMRAQLVHEAHDNLSKWIGSNNGRVVVDGKIELAHSPQSAEGLAAKIINGAVDDHDQRTAEAVQGGDAPGKRASAGRSATPGKDGRNAAGSAAGAVRPSAAADGSVAAQPLVPDNVSGSGGVDGPGMGADLPVGTPDPATGRVVTQPTPDLEDAQGRATAAAPDLEATLGSATDQIPGAEVDGIRDEKDSDRATQKVEDEGKPAHTMSDLLAGRVAVDSPEAKDQVVDAIKQTAPVIDEEDNFHDGDPDYGFRSHTLQTVMPNGSSAEVQVVPQEIAEADDDTHATYEKGRQAEIEGDDKAAAEAKSTNKAAHDAAMDKFNQRNGVSSVGDYDVVGEPIKIGNRTFLAVNPKKASGGDNQNAPKKLAKGDQVTLKDGSQAEVAFSDPAMGVLRVKVDGRHFLVNPKDVVNG